MITPAAAEYYVCILLNRCTKCKVKLVDVEERVVDRIDYTVCEMSTHCKMCGNQVDYYAYGFRESEQDIAEFERAYPKASELIKKMIGVNK